MVNTENFLFILFSLCNDAACHGIVSTATCSLSFSVFVYFITTTVDTVFHIKMVLYRTGFSISVLDWFPALILDGAVLRILFAEQTKLWSETYLLYQFFTVFSYSVPHRV